MTTQSEIQGAMLPKFRDAESEDCRNELKCVVLYKDSKSSRVLIHPFVQEGDDPIIDNLTHSEFTLFAEISSLNKGKIKFSDSNIWNDAKGEHAVKSRHILMDMLRSMQKHGYSLMGCADLYCSKRTAGTLFFSPLLSSGNDEEMACFSFHHADKLRLINVPDDVACDVSDVIHQYWKFGLINNNIDKHGVPEYKFHQTPWITIQEANNEQHLAARKLMMGILKFMYDQHGYHRVVAVDCAIPYFDVGDLGDLDSLVFYRRVDAAAANNNKTKNTDFCCVSLDKLHKIRLINDPSDEATTKSFIQAVEQSSYQISGSTQYEGSYQIKTRGRPWGANTTTESIAAATLTCQLIQGMFSAGWRWHCAIDMTRHYADKSTFFFRRGEAAPSSDDEVVACVQPKGLQKINFVRFPSNFLPQLVAEIKTAPWCPTVEKAELHDANNGTVKFGKFIAECFDGANVQDTTELYLKLVRRILKHPGARFLGSADIFSCEANPEMFVKGDTDVFFFTFPSNNYEVGSLRSVV